MTLYYMADGYISLGNPLQAKILLEEALRLDKCSDDQPSSNYVNSIIAHCQSLLGIAHMALGEYDQARRIFKYQPGYPPDELAPIMDLFNRLWVSVGWLSTRENSYKPGSCICRHWKKRQIYTITAAWRSSTTT